MTEDDGTAARDAKAPGAGHLTAEWLVGQRFHAADAALTPPVHPSFPAPQRNADVPRPRSKSAELIHSRSPPASSSPITGREPSLDTFFGHAAPKAPPSEVRLTQVTDAPR